MNLRIDTLTAQRAEMARIEALRKRGYFEDSAFSLLQGMQEFSILPLAKLVNQYQTELEALMSGRAQPSNYRPNNTYFDSPDAQILYLMIRSLKPKRIVEVGSGHSTLVIRQAIFDGQLKIDHTAIDPSPRVDIADFVSTLIRSPVESLNLDQCFRILDRDDILFIDSSHEVRIGNDVAYLYAAVLPSLKPGVVVHIHDVFLPFDYQTPFIDNNTGWGEQYLLQAFLSGDNHTLLWPGFYLQSLRSEEFAQLGFEGGGRAQSFWFRICK